jgi:uncharacterized protein
MPKYVMSDGRAFTTYSPNCALNKYLQDKYEVSNSHMYRRFLQQNAQKIMKELSQCTANEDCEICPICNKALQYKPVQ